MLFTYREINLIIKVPIKETISVTPVKTGRSNLKAEYIPSYEAVSTLSKVHMPLFCHSGLDPESSADSRPYVSGCRLKSGMTRGKCNLKF